MTNNSKQCAYWFLTIHESAKCFSNLSSILEGLLIDNPNFEYSYILHNPDVDDDCHHYHVVLYFKGKVKRFTTIQTWFEGSHIEQTNKQRYFRCIQYLIHKNNPEKFQYDSSLIVSNIDVVTLDDILLGTGYDYRLFEPDKIDDYMLEIYSKNSSISVMDFIKMFGLDAIKSYYFILKDLIKEFVADAEIARSRLYAGDSYYRGWLIYSRDLKREYTIASSLHLIDIDFETFERQAYEQFVEDVQRGYISLSDFRKEAK